MSTLAEGETFLHGDRLREASAQIFTRSVAHSVASSSLLGRSRARSYAALGEGGKGDAGSRIPHGYRSSCSKTN